jgi:hypothetical protein
MDNSHEGGAMTASLRPIIEDEVERLIGMLDAMDANPDLEDSADREPVCEDEGAQLDDEGFRCDDEFDGPDVNDWRAAARDRDAATSAAQATTENLRRVMRSRGQQPVAPLRTLAGAILR